MCVSPPCPGSLRVSCLRAGTCFLCWHGAAVPPPRHCPRHPQGLPGGKVGLSGAPRARRVLLPSPSPTEGLRVPRPGGPQPLPSGVGWGGGVLGSLSITVKPLGDAHRWAAGAASPTSRDAHVLPTAWHCHDSTGTSLPLQGHESPPGRVLSPHLPGDPPPERGKESPDPSRDEARVRALPAPGVSSRLAATPASPGVPRRGGGGEAVCRTRRSCAAEAPPSPLAQRLAREELRLFTQTRGAPALAVAAAVAAAAVAAVCHAVPRSAGSAGAASEVWRHQPRPPIPAPHRMLGFGGGGGSAVSPDRDQVLRGARPSVCPFGAL